MNTTCIALCDGSCDDLCGMVCQMLATPEGHEAIHAAELCRSCGHPKYDDDSQLTEVTRRCQYGNCRNWHCANCDQWSVVLTTAHLDHTPENCEPDNLRAMCNRCHLSYDRDHHAATRAATIAARRAA